MARKYTLNGPKVSAPQRAAGRVSLTNSALQSQVGIDLLALLTLITEDGEISLSEIDRLKRWLDSVDIASLPSLTFLKGEIEDILEDGKITASERVDLFKAIERVLPPEFRAEAKARRLHAEGLAETDDEERRPLWHDDPPTDAQLRYLRDLGCDPRGIRTKGEASDAIAQIVSSSKSVTNRQMMVLRFWNKVEYAEAGKAKVSEWMDAFYAQDPDHHFAWCHWKDHNGDTGQQSSPSVVPLGIGYKYLALVKGASNKGCSETISGYLKKAIALFAAILVLVIALKVLGWI